MASAAVLALAAPAARASFHTVDGTLNVDSTKSAEGASLGDVGGVPYRLQAVPRFAGRNGRAIITSFHIVR